MYLSRDLNLPQGSFSMKGATSYSWVAFMKRLFTSALAATFLFFATLSFAIAQENEVAFFGDDMIAVSTEQNERFVELEEKLGYAVESMRDELKKLQAAYEGKRKSFETARLNLLTATQKAELEGNRRTRLLRESNQQQ